MNTLEDAATVHIVCATLNGGTFLGDFVESLRAQTHSRWVLWVRDDGSTDDTEAILDRAAREDGRVRVLHRGGPARGAGAAFAWLLERVPADARYVMCADQDDVWLPEKIARTLALAVDTERKYPGPVLVHTDLRVVNAALTEIAPSFWQLLRIVPEPPSLERLTAHSLVTGATVLVNRALLDRALPVPAAAIMHDWWLSCVAAACGRIVALDEVTVLYRQHGTNLIGAGPPAWDIAWPKLPAAAVRAMGRTPEARQAIDASARQAGAVLARYAGDLTPASLRFLRGYAGIPSHGIIGRKLALLRWRVRREYGVLRNLGTLLRG